MPRKCPEVDHEYAYYAQSGKSMPEIGSIFAAAYKEWAWGKGKASFPKEYFTPKTPPDVYIKYAVAQKLKALGPDKSQHGYAKAALCSAYLPRYSRK